MERKAVMPAASLKASLILLAVLVLLPGEALARAGGGGGGGVPLLLLPLALIYAAILSYIAHRKNKESRRLLEKLQVYDNTWDHRQIKHRVQIAFFKVQEAWMTRNPETAREYVSEQLYSEHKLQIEQMVQQHRKNVLEKINLEEARVVEVADFKDDSKDRLWVLMSGSMIDYIIDDKSGAVISGKKDKPEGFSELWKFLRSPTGWVLDEIDQDASITDLLSLHSASEVLSDRPKESLNRVQAAGLQTGTS